MAGYVPNTPAQQAEMLAAVGLAGLRELYAGVPQELLLADGPAIPAGKSELEVRREMEALAAQNTVYPTVFRGAGAYRHYIPAIVADIAAKERFRTAYTPYQAEISQGILQAFFEYQTMICELMGLDASNASVYDGATAAAEGVALCRAGARTKTLVSAAAHPDVIEVIRTYCWAAGCEMELVPAENGVTDPAALRERLDDTVAAVYLQQPNFFGMVEDATAVGEATHAGGAKFVMGINPIAAALLKTPGECGADVAVGEGQPLGMPLAFGGPYLGFMAVTKALMRKLPGRIVGQTADAEGRRAFVLTMQAREQHIRREKAGSNICSNQALCALTASAYMAAMGPGGLAEVAGQCYSKAHYLAEKLSGIGFARAHEGEFFHEFVTRSPVEPQGLLAKLSENGILGGLPVEGGILWCVTELNTKDEMDKLVSLAKEAA